MIDKFELSIDTTEFSLKDSISMIDSEDILPASPTEHNNLINTQNISGRTLLHYACEEGDIDFILILIKKGSSLNIKCNIGRTPLDLCSKDVFNLLIKNICIYDNFDTAKCPCCLESADSVLVCGHYSCRSCYNRWELKNCYICRKYTDIISFKK